MRLNDECQKLLMKTKIDLDSVYRLMACGFTLVKTDAAGRAMVMIRTAYPTGTSYRVTGKAWNRVTLETWSNETGGISNRETKEVDISEVV